MAKLIKGDNVQNIITDGDVIVTSPSKIGKTLDEVLIEQQSDIDRLKSNVKYIYAYGGVGGSGSGGIGTGEKPATVFITLNDSEVANNAGDIVLDGKGVYKLHIKINNAGEKTYFVGYSISGSVSDNMMKYKLNAENRYKQDINISLNENGTLNIKIVDSEDNIIGYYSQKFIVESDVLDVTLNYIDINNESRPYSEPFDCFVTDPYRRFRYFKINYSIFLLNYSEVKVTCQMDGGATVNYTESDNIEIPIENDENCAVFINNEPLLQNKHMGTYKFKVTLSYKISGREIIREKSITFSIVPSDLYINVRTVGDVLYDDINLLKDDILSGGGVPHKCISQGTSLMMYCKVFEGDMEANPYTYTTEVRAFNAIVEDGDITGWDDMDINEGEQLTEREESLRGVSITFPTEGIKKITIKTKGAKPGENYNVYKTFVKYVFVKKFDTQCDWFNANKYSVLGDSYFRANQGDNTYQSFPQLSSGKGVLSLTKSANPITIKQDELDTPKDTLLCTVISLGIQVSNINSENAKIVDIYTTSSTTAPTYPLKINTLFANDGTNKIAIPTEILNKNDNRKYHLVQIIRHLSGWRDGVPVYEDSLYIDGLLESSAASTTSWASKVTQIVLQNINICYNLINIQYFSPTHDGISFNPDRYAYQYWLAYKEKYVNSSNEGARLTEGEMSFVNGYMDRIFFDGTNVVVDPSIVMDIATISNLPTVVFGYNCKNGDEKSISEFMEVMWMGRPNGDNTFGSRKIDLYWIPNGSVGKIEDYKVSIPETLTDNTKGDRIAGNWEIDLQGTSTMRNRIKNYSLRINSESSTGKDKILFSPKFNIDDPSTFLPDVEWTIKADIADSAHANNTSIGKFVNDVCSPIDTNIPDINNIPEARSFIKNTLEGIPVLLYFMCEDGNNVNVYYFGVYNFNLGRNSYYNLGYNGGIVNVRENESDFMRVFKHITNNESSKYFQDNIFTFAVGECSLSPHIAIGEIQENAPQFDFHQFDPTLLFKEEENNNNCMFGSKNKVTSTDFARAKVALGDLVKGVAKAGKYCFKQAGRENDFITSMQFNEGEVGPIDGRVCLNRYIEEKIPDPKYQIQYVNNRLKWVENHECDNVSIADLKKLIIEYEDADGNENVPLLNFKSASEYYTICMAFGMVDSVLKNMNLKNFRSVDEGPNFYCAFYDMDCALEEANDGMEKITYLAATDYWYSPVDSNNKVSVIEKKNDYWNSEVGSGFDFTSSYLFAVVKYAKSIFDALPEGEEKYVEQLSSYPQRFWANLRKYGGKLQSAEYFMNNYFKSGISNTFEYLASLNYRVKYLYHGEVLDGSNTIVKYLANGASFNGSRKIKAKNWLSKRLRFLDAMMNVNGLTIPVADNSMLKIPKPGEDITTELMQNTDITILHSAFDTGEANQALSNFSGEVEIYAPAYTPFIFAKGTTSADMYLLPGGVDKPNLLYFTTTEAEGTRFYGSGLFTSVNKIESMFTAYYSIVSDNLEKIEYGGTNVRGNAGRGLIVNAKSVREINLNIPKMGGELVIHKDCISLEKINIAGSEFHGTFAEFPNLQEVNISGVKTDGVISVSNSEHLTGERFYISGKDEKNKTSLTSLKITGVTGNFICENTDIESINIQNTTNRTGVDFNSDVLSDFTISNDSRLTSLTLGGFKKVSITSCNNLVELSIDDALEELYINLAKGKGETESALKTIFLNKSVDDGDSDVVDNGENVNRIGVFDFTNYPNLKKVTLINCDQLEWIKLPGNTGDKKDKPFNIETDGIYNNPKLKWIDTGILPAFLDVDNKTTNGVGDGYIEGVGDYSGKYFPIYSESTKLILCSDNAFYNCPNYAMLRSDWDKGENMIGKPGKSRIAYTNITVSPQCTSLANTFSISGGSADDKFNMNTAIRFIEKCVPDDVKANITSLSGCFRGRKNVKYTSVEAKTERGYTNYPEQHLHPMLVNYKSVDNISGMYENTGVNFVSKNLLDLPSANNNILDSENYKTLNWNSFIQGMSKMNIASDALYNISYRLTSYSYISFNIYEYNGREYVLAGKDANNMFKICDFFYPFDDGKKVYTEENGCSFSDDILVYNSIKSIDALNFGDQYIDFRGMFKLFPEVQTITSFLNKGNLSKYNLHGLLKPCKNIVSIIQSFNDSNINNSDKSIDLFEFFNWEENTTNVSNLFEGSDPVMNGFEINKTISYNNFVTVLDKISQYSKLTRLTNLFSYCTITGYNNEEIKFNTQLNNITNISNLFENCTSDYRPFSGRDGGEKGIYNGGVLNIGRSFFKQLPSFAIAQRTFANTHLSSSFTYDYFCKKSEKYKETDVFLSENQSDMIEAKLFECGYSSNITNLKECFYNTKFVNCKNWFDPNDDVNIGIINQRNYISTGDSDESKYSERGYRYYTFDYEMGSYKSHVLDNDVFDDCLDNYTDYVPNNSIRSNSGAYIVWYNHDLSQDFTYYGNIKNGVRPFNPINEECVDTIQQTYCCLPPDFLYGCNSTAIIDGIFANTNIIGVIPRNLTKKIRSQSISNIFRNVNIMPNLEYYYDIKGGLNNLILDKVVDVDSDSDDEYTVVFRDEIGRLKKRKPVSSDRNLGQFVYVPANFTTSGTLMNAFNFRYNLPRHWEMPAKFTKEDGSVVESYKSTNDFNNAIKRGELKSDTLAYHSQYYFLTDNSVKWNNVYDAKSLFISNSQDIDFSNKNTFGSKRYYYNGSSENTNINVLNAWTIDNRVSTYDTWRDNVIENFNIDLNLCGKKNENNMIEDYGCPVNIDRSVHLDNFVSGILTIFLNGRIFDHTFAVDKLTTSNHKSSSSSAVIGYYGFGKNMILPQFSGSPLDDRLSFIPIDNESIYFDFMVDNDDASKSNYHNYFAKDKLDNNKYLFDENHNKYTLK